jgi:WD40 repeat protein
MSPDGQTIAAGGYTGRLNQFSIYLFERATGRMVGRIGALPAVINHLAFSPDGSKLGAALGNESGARLFDTKSWRQLASDSDYDSSCGWLAFAPDGRVATTSDDGKIRLYGPMLDNKRPLSAPDGHKPFSIAFSPDGDRIAVGYTDTRKVSVLDSRSFLAVFAPSTSGINDGTVHTVAWSADGATLIAAGTWPVGDRTKVRSWSNSGRGAASDHPLALSTIDTLVPLVGGRMALAAADPRVVMTNRSHSIIWQAEPPTADFPIRLDQFLISGDGSRVLFGFERWGKSPARFDLRQRRIDTNPPADATLTAARNDGLDIKDWFDSKHPTLADKSLELDHDETSYTVAIAPDRQSFILGTSFKLRRFDNSGNPLWQKPGPSAAWTVNVSGDGRLVIAAYGDGTIRWYRFTDGEELLAFFPHRDGKRWVAWTPLGQYAASPGGEDLIRWQINQGLDRSPEGYTASRFREQFYRPDVIERVLDDLDPAKAVESADRAAGRQQTVVKSVAEDTPPRVAIIDPAEGTFVDKPELTVAYTVEDKPGTAIRRLRLLLDGRAAADARNLTVPANGRFAGEFKIIPQGDASVLTLLAESDKGSSDPATIRVRRNAKLDDFKPDLYVLSVGVSTFQNQPKLKLNYAAADAKDFARRLKQQEGGLYRRVLMQTLTDASATRRRIKEGFQWLERQVTARDVAVVFFSTHGAPDGRGKLLLLPSDVDTQDQIALRDTSITFAELQDTLVRLAERGRTMVFLDACHSGNIIPGTSAVEIPDLDKAASELASAENGVVVFSSSTGTQLSQELKKYEHGAFTEALLEAFDTKSASHEPPYLYVTDFDIWLRQRVKDLTNGAQTPQTTVPGERLVNPRVFIVRAQ